MTERFPRLWLACIALYLVLAIVYGLVNPLFEAPDEHWHYFTAQAIADTGRLPVVTAEPDPWLGQEAAQPPLYYVLGALIIAPVDTAGARVLVWPNPNAALGVGDASALANRNAFVHGPWEAWPWQGYALAAHLLRLFSTLLGAGTLVFLYASARLLWPDRPVRVLLAVALVAFLPQYLFLHSSASNDPLIVLLATAALYQVLHFWFDGGGRRSLVILGLTVGLAILSKTAGLLLLLFAAFAVWLEQARRTGRLVAALRAALWVIVPALLAGGWLLWRNWQLYGDPTAANQFIRLAGGDRDFTLLQVLGESSGLWLSLFAVFGWFNVRAPLWAYTIWSGLALFALGSAGWRLIVRGWPARERLLLVALLAGWVVLVYAGLVSFMLRTPAAQGRLLFPALLPLALGLAYGLDRPVVRWVAPLLALGTAVWSVAVVIPAVYQTPPVVAALPERATPLAAELEHGLALIGAAMETEAVHPGEPVWLTLYWQGEAGSRETAPQRVVELFGRDADVAVGKTQGYHGNGLWPTPLWPGAGLVADRVGVQLAEGITAPVAARAYAGLVGEETRVLVGRVKIVPENWPAAPVAVALIGEGMLLGDVAVVPQQAAPGETVAIRVTWAVDVRPGKELTTFVHLGEPGSAPLAVGDSPPLQGDYPTSFWARGEVIRDTYTLPVPADLPAGRYPLLLGLYEPESGQRLPVTVDGVRQEHDSYLAGWIEVVAPVEELKLQRVGAMIEQ
jgi:hypothetical protein